MANEINLNLSANCRNGIVNLPFQPGSKQADQTTAAADFQTPTVDSANHAQMDFGNVTTPGFVGLEVDDDETNFVEIGIDDGGVFKPLIQVDKDTPAVFKPASGVTLYQKADTADVKMAQTTYST